MADISEGSVPLGQMRLSLTKGGVGWRPPGGPPLMTITPAKYTCPIHGDNQQALRVGGSDDTLCIRCIADAFVKMGVQKVERTDG